MMKLGVFYWADRKVTCAVHKSWKWMLRITKLSELTLGVVFLLSAAALALIAQFGVALRLSQYNSLSFIRLLSVGIKASFLCAVGIYIGTFVVAPIWRRMHQWLDGESFSYSNTSSDLGYLAWSNLLVSGICLCLMWKCHISLHGTALLSISLSYWIFTIREEPRQPKRKKERKKSEALNRLLEKYRAALRPLKPALAPVRVAS